VTDCDKLLQKARDTKRAGLRFEEAIKLAQCFGFEVARRKGSHVIMKRAGYRDFLNFQPRKDGKAKAPQVGQLLDAIDDLKE
jgi:predicted RNA binding protein YcfA (HicA-like mRNA interferase family)